MFTGSTANNLYHTNSNLSHPSSADDRNIIESHSIHPGLQNHEPNVSLQASHNNNLHHHHHLVHSNSSNNQQQHHQQNPVVDHQHSGVNAGQSQNHHLSVHQHASNQQHHLALCDQFTNQQLFSLTAQHSQESQMAAAAAVANTTPLGSQAHSTNEHLQMSTISTRAMSQLLDSTSSQQLAARFNVQQAAANLAVTGAHFTDGLTMSDANQFVSVIQQHHQQLNPHIYDAVSSFNQAPFFQHNQQTTAIVNHNHQAAPPHHNQHHHHHNSSNARQTQSAQQLPCVVTTNTDNRTNIQLASNGRLANSSNQSVSCDGVFEIPSAQGAALPFDVIPVTTTSIVTTTMSEFKPPPPPPPQQQHQQPQQVAGMLVSSNSGQCERVSNSIAATSRATNIYRTNNVRNNRGSNSENGAQLGLNPMKSTFAVDNTTNQNWLSQIPIGASRSGANSSSNGKTSNRGAINKGNNCAALKKNDSKCSGNQRSSDSPRRAFACPTCDKGFTEKFNMKRHMQIHSQSRPKYLCNECTKSFAWKDNFIRHKKAAHGASLQQLQV